MDMPVPLFFALYTNYEGRSHTHHELVTVVREVDHAMQGNLMCGTAINRSYHPTATGNSVNHLMGENIALQQQRLVFTLLTSIRALKSLRDTRTGWTGSKAMKGSV